MDTKLKVEWLKELLNKMVDPDRQESYEKILAVSRMLDELILEYQLKYLKKL